MATIKAEIYRHWNMELAPSVKEANELMIRSFAFPDFQEGVQSFVQRRNPDFEPLPADYEVLPKDWSTRRARAARRGGPGRSLSDVAVR